MSQHGGEIDIVETFKLQRILDVLKLKPGEKGGGAKFYNFKILISLKAKLMYRTGPLN